ncbi:TadE/TadG family type IV pilus assembly protein [Flavimaricola marinus]|uniref:TadE-like protein n=1 Tax=Flavimaricola marinus TaxID=1819565 RepID=A0A238L8U9_9RHOB|nr:TadE/TadG family type IV pilus assembly protein [Flavimaricola marinus]SMY06127.1 TadE-like protein [Flavimaricola marinus]
MRAVLHMLKRRVGRFGADDRGTTIVELAIALPLFLLIFFALLDFGRMAYRYVAAEKAMQLATRIAVTRPPACAGVPLTHVRGPTDPGTAVPRFGLSCSSGPDVCLDVGAISCVGSAENATASEIWALIGNVLPNTAEIDNLRFSYSFDNRLGFLGGPYVPVVTVEVTGLQFEYASPLGALATLAGSTNENGFNNAAIPFPSMSMSLPAEDLALGDAG